MKITPMMKQFHEMKQKYSDCILFFRSGDFYEMFYDDAKIASKVLGITLTQRGGVPMAGVPYHSVNPYIKKFIQNNYKIAICEQLEDPKLAKGVVKRGVTRVITPGTILEEEFLSSSENNYIMAIYVPNNLSELYGISITDITTGEFLTLEVRDISDVRSIIKKYSPNEIILNEKRENSKIVSYIKSQNIYYNFLSEIRFNYMYCSEVLKKQFGLSPDELGLNEKKFSVLSAGALLFYIYKLQNLSLKHINKIKYINFRENLVLDDITLRNLEVVDSLFIRDNSKTLFGVLDFTKTAGGKRLLKKFLLNPLLNVSEINCRLDAIEELNQFIFERDEIRDELDDFYDIERITSRISSGIATPKDLLSLKISLKRIPKIKELLEHMNSKLLVEIKRINHFSDIVVLLESAISEDAQSHFKNSGYIKRGYSKELDELYDLAYNSKSFLSELEERERNRTRIPTLKVKYNKVFGYFIEVPKARKNDVPDEYILKQTLVNNLRFTIPELKEKESLIINAEERIKILEREIFDEILGKLKLYIKKFQDLSYKVSLLDFLISGSFVSQAYNYTRPIFSNKTEIFDARNPIVERFVESFVPNDIIFNENETFKVITGPNMAGKSTYLRTAGLIILMAQAGLFVPASKAKLKVYDRIFTRIGAHDELAVGQSTFMVEMVETANILNNCTTKSLVLLDEIGRGTSTYDGLAIAWAVTEFLAEKRSDTIFATHYHQLNKLELFFPNIVNYNVLVKENGDEIEFIRKIVRGGTDKSYGIYVAKLAGIPKKVIDRAKNVLQSIENEEEILIKEQSQEIKRDIMNKVSVSRKNKKKNNFKKLTHFFE